MAKQLSIEDLINENYYDRYNNYKSYKRDKGNKTVDSASTLEWLYEYLKNARSTVIERARRTANVTIPDIIADYQEDDYAYINGDSYEFKELTQNTGTRVVLDLAGNINDTLFSALYPFFRLSMDEIVKEDWMREQVQLNASQDQSEEETRKQIETKLANDLSIIERTSSRLFNTMGGQNAMQEAIKHLVVTGNSLLHIAKEHIDVFHLPSYTIERSPDGKPKRIIIEHRYYPHELPKSLLNILDDETLNQIDTDSLYYTEEDVIHVYTGVDYTMKNNFVISWQECLGNIFDIKQYRKEYCPYIPIRFERVSGDSYGRGYSYRYINDLEHVETITKAIKEIALMAARVYIAVDPASYLLDEDEFKTLENGQFISANPNDIKVIQMEKQADLQFLYNDREDTVRRLESAHMIKSSSIRSSPRTTATEVNITKDELRYGISDFYKLVANECQIPLARVLVNKVLKDRRYPQLPKFNNHNVINFDTSTGSIAVEKENKAQKFIEASTLAQSLVGQEQFATMVNSDVLMQEIETMYGLDNFVNIKKSNQEVQQELQAQQVQQQQLQQNDMAFEEAKAIASETARLGVQDRRIAQQNQTQTQ